MAYDLKKALGYGDGRLGDVYNPLATSQVNSYVNVTAVSGNTLTVDMANASIGTAIFEVGGQALIHVSCTNGVNTDPTYLGVHEVVTITAINGNTVTIDKDLTAKIPSNIVSLHYIQLVSIAQYNTLTLTTTISPIVFSTVYKYGGILAIKCKTGLVLNGTGGISLTGKGIPTANSTLRPLTAQETEMTSTGNTIGWENHVISRQALLNSGDGLAFIWTKSLSKAAVANANLIGGATGGAYNTTIPTIANYKGGATICLVAETISNFAPTLIAKSNGTGAGYGACYIATETALQSDEYLFSQDCISNENRLASLGIKSFGSGILGDVTNPTLQLNSYAAVTAISGKQITIGTPSLGGYGGFDQGTDIIVHVSASKSGATAAFGKFYKTKILSVSGSILSVADNMPFTATTTDYYIQVMTLPSFNKLTISTTYDKALAWNDTSKIGGICAISCKDTLDLTNGKILMTSKGLPANTERPSIVTQCSGKQKDYLPISQGSGAVLLISNIIKMNNITRLGTLISGAIYGGGGGAPDGADGIAGNIGSLCKGGQGGFGGALGTFIYGVNSGGTGGVSIFIVANTINTFNISAISIGGGGGGGTAGNGSSTGNIGGAGYGGGGGGGYNNVSNSDWRSGAPGGSSGTCFIYVNELVSPDYTAYKL